jgi:hypothetical protein
MQSKRKILLRRQRKMMAGSNKTAIGNMREK